MRFTADIRGVNRSISKLSKELTVGNRFISELKNAQEENVEANVKLRLHISKADPFKTVSRNTKMAHRIEENVTSGVVNKVDKKIIWTGDQRILNSRDPIDDVISGSADGFQRRPLSGNAKIWEILESGTEKHGYPITPLTQTKLAWPKPQSDGEWWSTKKVEKHPGILQGRNYFFKDNSLFTAQTRYETDNSVIKRFKYIFTNVIRRF